MCLLFFIKDQEILSRTLHRNKNILNFLIIENATAQVSIWVGVSLSFILNPLPECQQITSTNITLNSEATFTEVTEMYHHISIISEYLLFGIFLRGALF
jgi:hypothetical protein